MNFRRPPLVSVKLREACQRQTCVRCGCADGTVCGRHYNGQRQAQYGKGRSQKCHDFAQAQLCNGCDAVLTEGAAAKGDPAARDAHSEEFLHLCMLTLIEREREGVLTVARGVKAA